MTCITYYEITYCTYDGRIEQDYIANTYDEAVAAVNERNTRLAPFYVDQWSMIQKRTVGDLRRRLVYYYD